MKLLISKKTGLHYIIDEKNGDYHCKEGTIKNEDLIDDNINIVKSSTGREFFKTQVNKTDEMSRIKRGPQIIMAKDIGYILSRTGIDRNSKIVEAGGGSGAATLFLSRFVKELHTYELNEDNIKIIEYNLRRNNVDNVKLTHGDLIDYIDGEDNIDLVFLDMPEPWVITNKNLLGLKKGGYVVCYVPSVTQILEIVKYVFERDDFYLEEVSEVILRHWRVKERVARPEHRKETDHTAFLVFVRKL